LSYFYLIFTDIFYFFYNLLYYRYKNGYFRNVSIERTEFPFIENYTNILVIFCLVITYGIFIFKKGITVNTVLIPAFLYYIISFMVDRWLLFHYFKRV
jgi:hypothetical protein